MKKQRFLERLVGSCSLFLCIFLFLSVNGVFAGEPKSPDPLKEKEKVQADDFKAKLDRIKNHKGSWSHNIQEVIDSLTSTVTKNFNCPHGSRVDKVTINITTKHIVWDLNLTIGGKKVPLRPNKVGYYIWPPSTLQIANRVKTFTAENYIMLDPNITRPQEDATSPLGKLGDEGLLYHELLHGQLLIDAMTNDKNWQKNVCNCNFDKSPMDENHTQIYNLEQTYLGNIAGATVKVVYPPAQTAKDADGEFEFEIADESILGDKDPWSWEPYYPEGSNIIIDNVKIKDGKIVAIGKLIDKTRSGFALVHIDPPSVFIFAGIETGILVLPYYIPTGYNTPWLIFTAFSLLLTGGYLLFRHKKKLI